MAKAKTSPAANLPPETLLCLSYRNLRWRAQKLCWLDDGWAAAGEP